ncbi:hypothetical protein QNK12_06525 [Neobacillus cucumis]|nr:hypothetical protein QNK12_06525 [Neobacillus cucumis]
MDKIKINIPNLNTVNTSNDFVKRMISQTEIGIDEINRSTKERIEREKRTVELLETNSIQNEMLIGLGELEVDFLSKINGNAKQMVELLTSLESINKINGTIVEANLLEIEKRLDGLINNQPSNKLHDIFLDEVKKQIVEKGVSFGLQFFFTGIKALLVREINVE